MKKLARAVVLTLGLLTSSMTASADVVTFNGLVGPDLSPFTTYAEAGFTLTPLDGSVLQDLSVGNPAPSVRIIRMDSPDAGGLTITLTGGGLFTFKSVDVSSDTGASTLGVLGSLNGVPQFLFDEIITGAPGFATELNALSGTAIDALILVVTPNSPNGFGRLDNIVLNRPRVPEPASITLVALGLAVAGIAGVRRTRTNR